MSAAELRGETEGEAPSHSRTRTCAPAAPPLSNDRTCARQRKCTVSHSRARAPASTTCCSASAPAARRWRSCTAGDAPHCPPPGGYRQGYTECIDGESRAQSALRHGTAAQSRARSCLAAFGDSARAGQCGDSTKAGQLPDTITSHLPSAAAHNIRPPCGILRYVRRCVSA